MVSNKTFNEMKKQVQKNHDTLTEMKPTFERMKEIFKPDGVFDKSTKVIIATQATTKSHGTQIKALWAIVIGVIVSLFILFVNTRLGVN